MKKIALVTGATGGIGLAVCENLGKNGYLVIVNDINEEVGKKAISHLEKLGIEAELAIFDVTCPETVKKHVDAIGQKYGHIDAVINGAGGLGGRQRFEVMDTEFMHKVMELNFFSVLYVTNAAIPYLKKGTNPSVITFTSIAGWNSGGPGAGIYGSSKAAVTTLTRAYAKDLAEYGIRANAVSPGTIDTPFHQETKVNNPQLFESWKQGILMKRFGEPSEVASVVEFLVSDKASYLTGEIIQINGGQAFL